MTVPLFPPTTTSPCRIDAEPLSEGPRFVRTDRMSRWHRVRSGIRYGDSRTVYHLWCTGAVHGDGFLAREHLPEGERVCGPCDGRAVGSGQEPAGPGDRALLFTPQALAPPRHCPGSRSQRLTAAIPPGTVGQCLACGDLHPIRAMGGPYSPRAAITQHAPGPGLVAPCPFHRWRFLTAVGGAIECSCGRPLNNPFGETK